MIKLISTPFFGYSALFSTEQIDSLTQDNDSVKISINSPVVGDFLEIMANNERQSGINSEAKPGQSGLKPDRYSVAIRNDLPGKRYAAWAETQIVPFARNPWRRHIRGTI